MRARKKSIVFLACGLFFIGFRCKSRPKASKKEKKTNKKTLGCSINEKAVHAGVFLVRDGKTEQKTTNIDLSSRIMTDMAEDISYHPIVIYFNEVEFMKNVSENFNILSNLRSIIKESEISII